MSLVDTLIPDEKDVFEVHQQALIIPSCVIPYEQSRFVVPLLLLQATVTLTRFGGVKEEKYDTLDEETEQHN